MNPPVVAEPAIEQSTPELGLAPTPATLSGLSIVLPCFDEGENVAATVREACDAASRVADVYEVLVVDDGSADDTRAIALGIAARVHEVRVVIHESNLGYGAALRSGFAAARMPWVFLTDADRQFDLEQLGEFVPLTAHADVVVGRRARRADPLARRVAARAWNRLVRTMFGLEVHDVDCAFKLMRRELLGRCELTADGAMISTELLVRLMDAGARI